MKIKFWVDNFTLRFYILIVEWFQVSQHRNLDIVGGQMKSFWYLGMFSTMHHVVYVSMSVYIYICIVWCIINSVAITKINMYAKPSSELSLLNCRPRGTAVSAPCPLCGRPLHSDMDEHALNWWNRMLNAQSFLFDHVAFWVMHLYTIYVYNVIHGQLPLFDSHWGDRGGSENGGLKRHILSPFETKKETILCVSITFNSIEKCKRTMRWACIAAVWCSAWSEGSFFIVRWFGSAPKVE